MNIIPLKSFFICFVPFLLTFGCTKKRPIVTANALFASLAQLEAVYDWNPKYKRYLFSNKMGVEHIVTAYPSHLVIPALVDRLDDSKPSNVTLKGQPVAFGIVCYQALTQLAYYEAVGSNGDFLASWAGYIKPDADATQIAAAKEAWLEAVGARSYRLL